MGAVREILEHSPIAATSNAESAGSGRANKDIRVPPHRTRRPSISGLLGLAATLALAAGSVLAHEEERSMPTRIDYAIESFRTTSGGLISDDLETLQRYGESGWDIDHAVAHGENQNDILFVFKRVTTPE
jgi:hypothetical protein